MPPGMGNKPLFEGKATLMSWSSDLLSGSYICNSYFYFIDMTIEFRILLC